MTYNVVTNIHVAHKLFVTTLMESFIILDTTSKKLTCKFYKVLQFCKYAHFKKGEILPFLGHKKGEILPFLKIQF